MLEKIDLILGEFTKEKRLHLETSLKNLGGGKGVGKGKDWGMVTQLKKKSGRDWKEESMTKSTENGEIIHSSVEERIQIQDHSGDSRKGFE